MEYKLSDLFELCMGKTPARNNAEYWNNAANKWIAISDLPHTEKYIYDTKEKISDIAIDETGIKAIPANTVIMSFKLSIGKVAITPEIMYSNEAIMAFIDKKIEEVIPDYIYYLFKHRNWNEGTNNAVMGKTLNKATLSNITIKLHGLQEQKEIVLVLDKINKIMQLKKEQIENLDSLVKAQFVEMFGDPVTNPMHWKKCLLSEYIEFLTSGSRGWAKYFTDQGKYFITIKNVKNCKVSLEDVQYIVPPDNAEAKRTKVQEDDLLISITADLGRTGVVSKEIAEYGGYINQHLSCIRLNKDSLCSVYVAYYLESEAGKRQFSLKNQSAVKAGLNFDAINSLKLCVPPIEIQNQFAAFVQQTDKSKVVIQKSLDELQTLFDSLMQEYFG